MNFLCHTVLKCPRFFPIFHRYFKHNTNHSLDKMHLYNCLTSSALLCQIPVAAMTAELITAIACDSIGHAVVDFKSVPGVALCSASF